MIIWQSLICDTFFFSLYNRFQGYGRLEGIPVKEYQGHAKRQKKRIEFTPEGGETIEQVSEIHVNPSVHAWK